MIAFLTASPRDCTMDKKLKKRLDVVNKKLQNLRQQLSGARQQDDEPGEIKRLETDIVRFEQEAVELKAS
jgi:uncharacterized coiled-coil DUF342 family protein